MLFPTLTFAVFFLLVYPISWWLRWRQRPWKLFILAVSYIFYGFWDWRFVFLIIASTLVNGGLAYQIARDAETRRKTTLQLALVFNLGLLCVFKYYGFFIESMNGLLRATGLPARLPFLEIILPVGISFFTFQAISYVVDVYRKTIPPAPILDVGVYLAFFPHVVAGPIVRAVELLPQLPHPKPLSSEDASRAALLIAQGMFKKVVISSYVASAIVDPVFAVPGQYSGLEVLMAIYGYAVQIYCDFSGYTDIAIGVALLLGIRFPQNFDRPYTAVSIQDFWRRWHMTLSRWLRDFLYIPLGGNRGGRWQTYRNLLLTMTLGGLWHGAAMTFVAWGFYHGLGLAVERWWGEMRVARAPHGAKLAHDPAPWQVWLGRLLTFHFVCIGWVLFRAPSFDTALEVLRGAVTNWGPAPNVTAGLVLAILGALALQFIPDSLSQRLAVNYARLPLVVQGAALGVFFALTVALGPKGVAPFIYFQF
ncbi:MAG: MBOAT family protein [Anaerolineae bacterium]|nr:MBOAT family protein [Anaerolineae bacterium]